MRGPEPRIHIGTHTFLEVMPSRLFLSSGDLMADRRFDFARDLQLKGDLAAAADLLMQAIELAPNFTSAQAGPNDAEASKSPPAISASLVSAK